jgi:hypothetical protein
VSNEQLTLEAALQALMQRPVTAVRLVADYAQLMIDGWTISVVGKCRLLPPPGQEQIGRSLENVEAVEYLRGKALTGVSVECDRVNFKFGAAGTLCIELADSETGIEALVVDSPQGVTWVV